MPSLPCAFYLWIGVSITVLSHKFIEANDNGSIHSGYFYTSIAREAIAKKRDDRTSGCQTTTDNDSTNADILNEIEDTITIIGEEDDESSEDDESDEEETEDNFIDRPANRISIAVANHFFSKTFPEVIHPSSMTFEDDRLVKAGRNIVDLVSSSVVGSDWDGDTTVRNNTEAGLQLLVKEYRLLAELLADSSKIQVPKVRFGKTNLQVPIITLGGMRFQQSWDITTPLSQVTSNCQTNLLQILRHAIRLGINHIETAQEYGCSELQLGRALQTLIASGEVRREDLIIQTKVPSYPTANEFREALETSFRNLQLEYVDLFTFHGLNLDHYYDQIFNNGSNGNCIDVVREYVAKGKIRHVGFSTHGRVELIRKFIETDEFEYVNLHYHYFGSYTATGEGVDGMGNRENVRLMKEKDMGVFIISVNDKGGRLYTPSKKLRSLTLPDMEPITFGSWWLWQHERLDEENAPVHTVVCGAARSSDLDQLAVAAVMHGRDPEGVGKKVEAAVRRLEAAKVEALGREWVDSWYEGLPKWLESRNANHFTQIVGLYNLIRSFGMLEYAKERYRPMEDNLELWDFDVSKKTNLEERIDLDEWGWTPGCAIRPGTDYSADFSNCPAENHVKLADAVEFVHKWCSSYTEEQCREDETRPTEFETAYDMRPWTAFPERD